MSENDEKEKLRLLILPEKRRADLSADATLLDALQEADIRIDSVCSGEGTCGKCGVRILKGEKPVTPQDEQFFDRMELADGWRLACQLRPMSDMEIELPAQPDESSRILRRGREIQFTLSPNVEKRYIEITPEDRDNNISDTDLVAKAAGMSVAPAFDPELLTDLPLLLREADYAVTITIWAGKVVRIEKGDTTKSNYGVALDIGTTTMVASLVNLSSGYDEASEVAYNPQRSFGEDVISRIKYCREHADGTRRLSSLVVEKAAAMIEKLCARKGISPDELSEIVAVGNPTMGHLLMGINPSYLGELPYRPVVTGAITSYKDSESLDKLPRVPVELPPNFSGFIGSDIVAGLLSQGIGEDEEIRLFVDIGTNAEIALGSKRELMVSNCTAGPAFDGARIECGMSGMEGAIDKLWIDDEDIRYHVIGDGEARGLCGSGLVDIVAA
ncbi:MAG: DUF4445 domain-containing protein, partial [Thermoplasmata archaeon]|nr:DUF4445 domain-containing protein [Thermoplasmata archaeon]